MNTLRRRVQFGRRTFFAFVLTAGAAISPTLSLAQLGEAAINPEQEREIRYVQALQEAGLLEYADLVISDLRRQYPDIEARIKVLELRGMLARGRFDDARQRIASEPDQDSTDIWAMRMALADGLYAYGRFDEAAGVYESFFKRFPQGPEPALNTFYRDSAYRYAQMLLYIGRLRPALDAYRLVFKAKLEPDEQRQVEAEMGELLLRLAEATTDEAQRKTYLADARKIADTLLWIQDVWFGKGIVLLAHLRMLEGDVGGAQDLVQDYLPQLRLIDEAIRAQSREIGQDLSKISPMAECRYLLGVMLQQEAERMLEQPSFDRDRVLALLVGERDREGRRRQGGALQHFVNVFIRYADTAWAPDAGERADRIESILTEKFGATINKQVTPEQWARVRRNLYNEARLLYSQNQFQAAIERYLAVLNRFPDVAEAVPALGELARCYLEENEFLMAETVIGYLAERFNQHPALMGPAGDELVRLGEFYGERGMQDRRLAVYDQFFRLYDQHAMAPSMLFSFGERFFREENYDAAEPYFEAVASTYTNLPIHYDALSRQASLYERTGQRTNEVRTLQRYIQRLEQRERPGQTLMSARFRLAQAIRNMALPLLRGDSPESVAEGNHLMAQAAVRFDRLIATLEDENHPYQTSAGDRELNRELLESAMFSKAYCLMMMTQPADQVETLNRQAIEAFEAFVTRFPDSPQAPMALSQVGTLWTIRRDPQAAQQALSRLRDRYPDSNEARNALFMLGRNLMDMGLRSEAVARFRQMFTESDALGAAELLSAGQELSGAGEQALALEAFDRVLARAQEPGLRGPALRGRAEALIALERFSEALTAAETLREAFPRTTLALEAHLLESRAASEAGMREADLERRGQLFYQASEAMKRVARYRETPAELLRIDLNVGRILARQARAEAQFADRDREARVRRFTGQAAAAFLQVTLNADPGNREMAAVLEDAYAEMIPLVLDLQDWRNAFEDAQTYLETFPRGRYVAQVRNWMNRARVELVARGELN